MKLSWKARRRWSIVFLIIGLPVYIVAAVAIIALFERPPILLELAVYVAVGLAWAFPAKWLFAGVGQPEPEEERKRPRPGDGA